MPILLYDLNQGGGLVSFISEEPKVSLLELEISLPFEGRITLHAEPVSYQPFGMGVRFVNLDADTMATLARAVDALVKKEDGIRATRH